jgi:hypothetical protein
LDLLSSSACLFPKKTVYGNLKEKKGKERTFVEGIGGGVHGMQGQGEEGEAVTGGGITDLGQDLGDGDEPVGAAGEAIAAVDDGVGVDHGHGYAFGGLAAIHEDLIRLRWLLLARLWDRLALQYVAPGRSCWRWGVLHGYDGESLRETLNSKP